MMAIGKRAKEKSIIQKMDPGLVKFKKLNLPDLTMPEFTKQIHTRLVKEKFGKNKLKIFTKKQERFIYGKKV